MASKTMPLWGWGDAAVERHLSEATIQNLSSQIGPVADSRSRVSSPTEFEIQTDSLSDPLADGLARVVGREAVVVDERERLLRAHGKSYPDMIKMRAGQPGAIPSAVVVPHTREELEQVILFCSNNEIAVVPYGGGTSVVGGLTTFSEGFAGSISLDLAEMAGLEELDQTSGLATFLPGTRGPEAERLLSASGFTLGHFPQSFEYGSIGGFVATRSAGQSSSGYGRIDRNLIGVGASTPAGRIDIPAIPGTAAGPDLRQLLAGSEGTLGVLDRLVLQVTRSPEVARDLAWLAPDFRTGREALRRLEQSGLEPTVARLSDEEETSVTLLLAGDSAKASVFRGLVRARGGGCILITCFEGNSAEVAHRSAAASDLLRREGCKALGSAPARAWRKGRFSGPYLRDSLLDIGYFVETLETATTWSNLENLYRSVGEALRSELRKTGGEPIVMCHVSHMYPTGASLYFTFVGATPSSDLNERLGQWKSVKSSACDAIIAAGGTISHHHAVGSDHSDWLPSEIGPVGISMLQAVKEEVDPAGIMNPGRLIPTRG